MSKLSLFNSPFLLGFDDLERLMDTTAKASSDGYPPYNIEQIGEDGLKITLALAGFSEDDLTVMVEDHQLIIRGKQEDDKSRTYLHRGIAARQFQRAFILAEGIELVGASLESGLLNVHLVRPKVEARQRIVKINSTSGKSHKSGSKQIDVATD
jgi:HSP20 family molecular chaperone IbpA